MSSLLDWLVKHEPSFRKTRLPSLYADLTVQKTSNPEGYAANVTAWQAALTRAALAGQLSTEQRLTLQTSDELLNALANRQYGQPSGLGSVIDEGVRSGKMIDIKDFLTLEKSIYSRSWIPSAWSILQWSLRQAGILGSGTYDISGRLRRGSLVLVQALEQISKQIIARQSERGQSSTDRIVSREAFARELADLTGSTVSKQDIDVLLRYLSRDKQLLSYDSQTIKFKSPNASHPEPITQEDTTIVKLKALISSLSAQTANLESNISSFQLKAHTAVKTGNKITALNALRSKKHAENALAQRTETLHQLEDVYASIEAAADQVAMVAVMEASAGLLKTLNQKVGGVERVDGVMDNLREEMGRVDEVGQVLQEPLDGTAAAVDEAEVDEELQAMEQEEKEKREAFEAEETRRRLADLEKEKVRHGDVAEEELARSTEQLRKMSIDPQPRGPVQEDQQAEPQQVL